MIWQISAYGPAIVTSRAPQTWQVKSCNRFTHSPTAVLRTIRVIVNRRLFGIWFPLGASLFADSLCQVLWWRCVIRHQGLLDTKPPNFEAVSSRFLPVSRNAVKAVIPISKSLRHIRNVSPPAVDANGNSVQMILRQCPISQDEVGALPETRANGC